MEKKMIDGIYTITDITSTSQVREFYKEVVANNIEKYVAITTQNIRFGFNPMSDAAVMLKSDETYALNPSYRKIEVEPIDKLVEEKLEESKEVVVEEVSSEPVESEEVINDTETEVKVSEETETPVEITEEEVHTDDPIEPEKEVETFDCSEELKKAEIAENEKLTALLKEQEDKLSLAEERAAEAEKQAEYTQKHCNDLEIELQDTRKVIEDQQATIEELENKLSADLPGDIEIRGISIDTLFEDAEKLGLKIFITK